MRNYKSTNWDHTTRTNVPTLSLTASQTKTWSSSWRRREVSRETAGNTNHMRKSVLSGERSRIEVFYWGERSEPHTCGVNGKLSVYLYIYIYGTCVFRIYVHPASFVRDAIFPHCMLVHVTTVAQETRLAGQKG